MFIFGNTVEDVDKLRHEGYNHWDIYNSNDDLKQILDQLRDGFFNDDKELYQPIIDSLLHKGDYFLVLSDYQAYRETKDEVEKLYKNQEEWYWKALQDRKSTRLKSSNLAVTYAVYGFIYY